MGLDRSNELREEFDYVFTRLKEATEDGERAEYFLSLRAIITEMTRHLKESQEHLQKMLDEFRSFERTFEDRLPPRAPDESSESPARLKKKSSRRRRTSN